MANLDKSFAKLIGRQPSEAEVKNLYRVRDALGLKENDALWLILMALESYDSLYRKYPEMIGKHVQTSVEAQRGAIAAMADQETRRALGTLSEAVSRTSEKVASRVLSATIMQSGGLLTVALLMFGSFCTTMGFVLASGRLPYWASPSSERGFAALIFSTLANTPAGWMAALIGAAFAIGALWHARKEIILQRRLDLVSGSILLATVSICLLWPAI